MSRKRKQSRHTTPANSRRGTLRLALVISVYRRRNTVVADDISMMKW